MADRDSRTDHNALACRGTWRDTKRRKAEKQAQQPDQAPIERPVVDAKTLPTAKLKRIMQTCIPGYDPWADPGECCNPDPQYETEVEYLHRLELLTPAEIELCNSGHTFQIQEAAEQCVETRPHDRYCAEALRRQYDIPLGSLLD